MSRASYKSFHFLIYVPKPVKIVRKFQRNISTRKVYVYCNTFLKLENNWKLTKLWDTLYSCIRYMQHSLIRKTLKSIAKLDAMEYRPKPLLCVSRSIPIANPTAHGYTHTHTRVHRRGGGRGRERERERERNGHSHSRRALKPVHHLKSLSKSFYCSWSAAQALPSSSFSSEFSSPSEYVNMYLILVPPPFATSGQMPISFHHYYNYACKRNAVNSAPLGLLIFIGRL